MPFDNPAKLGALLTNGAAWGLALAAALFAGSLALVVVLVVCIPADYFREARRPAPRDSRHPALRWTWRIGKNILGAVLFAAGLVMLVTPGQGLLTLLVGLMLLDVPGKRRLERNLVRRPHVLAAINRLRARFGKPPLVV